MAKTRYKGKSSCKEFDRVLATKRGEKSYINNEHYINNKQHWDFIEDAKTARKILNVQHLNIGV